MSLLPGLVIPLNTSIGHNHEENQVSSTSASCLKGVCNEPYFSVYNSLAADSFSATTIFPVSSYQAGICCPHHNCRLMHQSFTFSNQYLYVAKNFSPG